MKGSILKILIFLPLTISLTFTLTVFATDGATQASTPLESILGNIKVWLVNLGSIVCGIFMVWGGYLMITSAGDPKKFETGKTALLYATIGLIVILIADKVVDFIKDYIVKTQQSR
jgi:hypothetical protein